MAALLDMNTSPAESEQALQVKTPMRFTYPSGSRPLEGYTIKRGVGRGGFGEVYFAVSDAGKEVALKLIRRNLEVELRGVTHCLNLKHPNLVALYDIRTDEHEDRWVVMEYVSGESLEDQIERYPDGMPTEVALKWFEGICSAVAYLHDHGIVHRDLKPANIFLDDGVVKIGDYGLSKFISCSRRSGQTESVGTVHYMAPEIANGRYGREIDAYALGIILYEMLTGRVPFEGESVGEVLMKHLTAEPNLEKLCEPFRAVVEGAMAKDPERRINSAAEMMARLRGVAVGPADGDGGGDSATPRMPRSFQAAAEIDQFAGTQFPFQQRPRKHEGLAAFFHRDPEPVRTAFVTAWHALRRDLNYESWSITGRIAFAVFCVVVFGMLWPVWFVLIGMGFAAYMVYMVVRVFVRMSTDAPEAQQAGVRQSAPPAGPQEGNAAQLANRASATSDTSSEMVTIAHSAKTTRAPWKRRGTAGWRQAAQQELLATSLRDRASSVIGSMLAAGIVAPVASFLACMVLAPAMPMELTLWMATTATFASWALMVPGQLAEARIEDHAPMRFMQLLLGALVGLVSWAVAQSMYVRLPSSNDFAPGPNDSVASQIFGQRHEWMQTFYGYGEGVMNMPPAMFAAYLAFLFVVLRWWRLSESMRPVRVSLWSTAWCAFVGWAMSLFWWFPQPTGLVLAAVIAFTIQLSSPWLSPSRRRELAQKVI
ncbi:MAG TPA: serine/threonine-protein kinase [Lacipirellula sp.]